MSNPRFPATPKETPMSTPPLAKDWPHKARRMIDAIRADIDDGVAQTEGRPLTGPNVAEAICNLSACVDGLAGILAGLLDREEQRVWEAIDRLSTELPECGVCLRRRTFADPDYTPMQIITGQPLGWYSGDDGQMCPECMTKTIRGRS